MKLMSYKQFRNRDTVATKKGLHVFQQLLLWLFPLFLVVLCEFNQLHSLSALYTQVLSRPNVLLFSVIVIETLYGIILFLVKRGYIAMLVTGVPLFTLSCIEYFKYKSSGTHFVLADLMMAPNASDMTRFADIQITPILVLNLLLLACYILLAFWVNARLWVAFKKCIALALSLAVTTTVVTFVPSASSAMCEIFSIDDRQSINAFRTNDKFRNNSFVAFLAQTTAEQLENTVKRPESYSKEQIQKLMQKGHTGSVQSDKPNVIFVMSEAFADFRQFSKLSIPDDAYKNFDRAVSEGYGGECVVPTFGGYTVKTEFELMMGLPVRALNNSSLPHKLLQQREQQSIVRSYQENGYSTAYIHPFSRTFYGRDEIYSQYGFDDMYFLDNLTVDPEYSRSYVTDQTVYQQINDILTDNKKPSYIFATTMQNHQPYTDDTGGTSGGSEFSCYIQGIRKSDQALGEFLEGLKTLQEPTLVFFIGDHYPFFSPQGNIYNSIGINSKNCDMLFVQRYFMWSNYALDYTDFPSGRYSVFYLPHMLTEFLGLSTSALSQTILSQSKLTPVYDKNYRDDIPDNQVLELLTYDIVKGEEYSGN